VVIQYNDAKSGGVLQLTAQRAVVFTNPGKLADTAQFTMENVRGIFLEGEVIASDGKYTLRGPQIYYDVKANRAVMLDAVFWTYDERRKLPLYVRAKSIRQTASDQFEAKSATFTNTAFFDPELSIGASTVTISRKTVPVEQSPLDRGATPQTVTATQVNARNVTLQVAGLPVFYWPWYSGDPANTPIRDFRFENFSGSGGAVKAVINAYSLLGLKTPDDLVFDFLTDYYFERGIGVGTRLAWKYPDSKGSLFAYTVPFDTGTDILKSGANLTHDNEFRGIIAGEQRWRVDDKWTVFAEGAAISDETFIDAFYENLGETRREFTNRLRADRTDRNTQATLEAKASFSDFISNEWLLQSRGYSVNKLPEAMYVRQADDLLSQTHPGLLSYWSEYRVGAISIAFDEIRPENRGYSTPGFASRAFGLAPNQSYADALRTRGYFEDTVYRADTRQELSLNMNAGPVKLTPFVVGRVTAYDNDFKQFSPDEDDSARLYGAAGIRASTTFQRVYDGVDSQLLDIHRLRHIVEPNITVWGAGTTIDGQDLPVYDDSVESLADGMIMRFGATQTFQTQRGAPGRWHNVDLLTLSTDFVVSSGSSQAKTPIGRFFDYRPEYSNPGNYFVGDGVYRLTDTLAFTGSTVYDFDRAQQAMSSTGFIVQHGLEFSTSVDLRYINALDSTYVNFGAQYQFTNKYSVSATAAYDLDAGGFQTNLFEVRRTFASMVFGLSVGYNDITGESSFGFVFRPFGAAGEARVSSGEQGADFGG